MEILFLTASVFVGAIIAGVSKVEQNQSWFRWILAFSGAYLFGITIVHILPEAYLEGDLPIVAASVLIGFLIQYILDFFSGGVEHGHFHHHSDKIPYGLLAGLFIHAFIESIPASIDHYQHHQDSILWAIIVHKVPISIVLFILMAQVAKHKWQIWSVLFAFAAMAPLGFWLGDVLPIFSNNAPIYMGFTAGIFLHVSTTIIFESEKNHQLNLQKMIAVFLGFVLAYIGVM